MINKIVVGPLLTNCYLLSGPGGETVIIDPGGEGEKISETIEKKKLKPVAIINTHAHGDHIGGNSFLKKKYKIPIYAHSLEFAGMTNSERNLSFFHGEAVISPPADTALSDNQLLEIGGINLKVMHTPGHTTGSVCLICGDDIFTGDTVFAGSVGRCDLPGGDEVALDKSIEKIKNLSGDYSLFPGHGPTTTLQAEKKINPFF